MAEAAHAHSNAHAHEHFGTIHTRLILTFIGGVLILNSSPFIRDNMIVANVLDDGYCLGAGIYIDAQASDHPTIENNLIMNNVSLSATVTDDGHGRSMRRSRTVARRSPAIGSRAICRSKAVA